MSDNTRITNQRVSIGGEISVTERNSSMETSPAFTQERLFRGALHIKASRLREVWQQNWELKVEIELQVKHESWGIDDRYVIHLLLRVTLKNQSMIAINMELVKISVQPAAFCRGISTARRKRKLQSAIRSCRSKHHLGAANF